MLRLSLKGTLYGFVLDCTCAYRMWSQCSKFRTTSECMKCTVNMFRLHQDCDYIRKVVLRKRNCLLPVQIHGTYHCDQGRRNRPGRPGNCRTNIFDFSHAKSRKSLPFTRIILMCQSFPHNWRYLEPASLSQSHNPPSHQVSAEPLCQSASPPRTGVPSRSPASRHASDECH